MEPTDREERRDDLAPTNALAKSRKKGGEACLEKYGLDHYRDMGQKGGNKTKLKQDADYYRRIGELGREARRKKKLERQILSVSSTDETLDAEGINAQSSLKE